MKSATGAASAWRAVRWTCCGWIKRPRKQSYNTLKTASPAGAANRSAQRAVSMFHQNGGGANWCRRTKGEKRKDTRYKFQTNFKYQYTSFKHLNIEINIWLLFGACFLVIGIII